MDFLPGDLVHVYNRGNNKQQVFFSDDNYLFFRDKIARHIAPVCDIVAYCLMPNHFLFLIQVNDNSVRPRKIGSLMSNELNNGFRVLQSSYAMAINKHLNRTGSLFQQKAKFKLLNLLGKTSENYAEICFHYIHQNPMKAGLVNRMEDWIYSSFCEHAFGADGVCRKEIASELFRIKQEEFYRASYQVLNVDIVSQIL